MPYIRKKVLNFFYIKVELVEMINDFSGFFTQIFDGTVYYFRLLDAKESLEKGKASEVVKIFQVDGNCFSY